MKKFPHSLLLDLDLLDRLYPLGGDRDLDLDLLLLPEEESPELPSPSSSPLSLCLFSLSFFLSLRASSLISSSRDCLAASCFLRRSSSACLSILTGGVCKFEKKGGEKENFNYVLNWVELSEKNKSKLAEGEFETMLILTLALYLGLHALSDLVLDPVAAAAPAAAASVAARALE